MTLPTQFSEPWAAGPDDPTGPDHDFVHVCDNDAPPEPECECGECPVLYRDHGDLVPKGD